MSYVLPEEVSSKLTGFPNPEDKAYLEECQQLHEEFLKKYPFRKDPSSIDLLTPADLYEKGGDYFFKWVENKLKKIGSLSMGSNAYCLKAIEKIDTLKLLLKTTIDDTKTIAQKVDAGWEEIPWFGGDRHIAKKIIYLYNSDKTLPMFKTSDMEYYVKKLGLNYEQYALEKYGKGYGILTKGQTYEVLTDLLLKVKPKGFSNMMWSYFFYRVLGIPPRAEGPWGGKPDSKPINSLGLLFTPEYEMEVVYLFSILHRELGFPYVIHLSDAFPDATVMTKERKVVKIEFEVYASSFIDHGHAASEADYIVCWENDLEEIPEKFPEIIAIKDWLEQEK